MTLQATLLKRSEDALSLDWYVVQTNVKMEQIAEANLTRQGFEVFLPLYKKQAKKKEMLLPLFPGYCFTRFDPALCRWQSIHSTIGVTRLLGYNSVAGTIMPVRDDVIPRLQAFSDERGVIDLDEAFPVSSPQYSQGDRVRILSGMFEGKYATYWNSSKDSSMIILQLLSRPVRVILRNEEITPG